MVKLLTFIFSNAGIVYIIKESFMFNFLHRWRTNKSLWIKEFFGCPLCLAWWSSIVPYLIIYNDYNLLNIFIFNCIGSITAYIVYGLIKKL